MKGSREFLNFAYIQAHTCSYMQIEVCIHGIKFAISLVIIAMMTTPPLAIIIGVSVPVTLIVLVGISVCIIVTVICCKTKKTTKEISIHHNTKLQMM